MQRPQTSVRPAGSRATIRNRGFATMGVLTMSMVGLLCFFLPFSVEPGELNPDLIALPAVMSGCQVFFYLLCFHPRLRLSEEGIEARGAFVTHFAPWRSVETLNAQGNGRLVIGLSNGEAVSHFHYGGSLGGDLIRYRHHRRAVRRAEEWRSLYASTGGGDSARDIESRVRIPVVPALVVFLLTGLLFLVGTVLHHLGV